MKNFIKIFLLLILGLMLIACSDESSSVSTEAKKDHVWKSQTDAIDKAKEVEGMILGAAEETRKAIEQQGE